MPSINLTTQKLGYTAADLAALERVATLLAIITQHDLAVGEYAETALKAIQQLIEHVAKQRAK